MANKRYWVTEEIGEHILPKLFFGCMISVLVLGVLGFMYYYTNKQYSYRQELRNQLEVSADRNNDGIVTREEMSEVYKSLGLRLNEVNPRELSTSEMERYLQMSWGGR